MGSYELEEEKIIAHIKKKGKKLVMLQLPDGLKREAEHLVPRIEKATGATVLLWFGTNFGACDLPVSVRTLGVDLVVAFGHNVYVKDVEGW